MKNTRSGRRDKNSSQYGWVATVFCIAVVLSAALSLASESLMAGAGMAVALLILALFIGLGILFDIIGVAVTAADEKPFHSMAAHREKGVIVAQLQRSLDTRTVLLSVGVTALISGLTIGGKALGKTFAIRKSTQVVFLAGRFLHLFHR